MYDIYKRLPIFLQNLICTIYGYREKKRRFGFIFKASLDDFIKSDFSTKTEIETLKKDALVNVLKSAKSSYLYPSLNAFSDHDIEKDPYSCLIKMPVLSKEELKGFCNANGDKKGLASFSTSGTTGKALTIFREKSCL